MLLCIYYILFFVCSLEIIKVMSYEIFLKDRWCVLGIIVRIFSIIVWIIFLIGFNMIMLFWLYIGFFDFESI